MFAGGRALVHEAFTMKDEIRMSVEIREDEDRLGPGRLVGVLMKYNTRAKDRDELFLPGSLKWDQTGVVVNRQHRRSSPILRVLPVVEGDEVRIDSPLPDSVAGRSAAAEIRSGLMTGLSVEFRATAQTIVSGVRKISAAVLSGAAIVDSASYPTSVEVRHGARRLRWWR